MTRMIERPLTAWARRSRRHAFELEQGGLDGESTGITGESSITTDHPMAGNNDRQRIAPYRGTDRPAGVRVTELGGQLAVAEGRAVADRHQSLPYPLLKRGTSGGTRY